MSQSYKICPICRTPAHPNAAVCSTCGATLSDVGLDTGAAVRQTDKSPTYDHRYGEADLSESQLSRKPEVVLLSVMLALSVLVCIGAVAFVVPRVSELADSIRGGGRSTTRTMSTSVSPAPTMGGAGGNLAPATNTQRPTLVFATVTPAPPTATATPTQGPCEVEVKAGDTLLSVAYSCGHVSTEIVPVILETNDLPAPEALQVGQVLIIPWPTPTQDPALVPTEEVAPEEDEAAFVDDDGSTQSPAERALVASHSMATETLQPGVTWHQVVANENIMSIAFQYGANIEILSQLNPEVTFSQCDFGSPSGGPNCIVNIYVGQLLRVPAPTPTPTIPPTPSGSETPTPPPSPTFNAPGLVSPDNRTLFERHELITLRWVGTGTLGPGQVYRVTVEDVTIGAVYTADTQDIFLIVPEAWQGQDGRRHDYQWSVSIIDAANPDQSFYTTDTRLFSWQGYGAATLETP